MAIKITYKPTHIKIFDTVFVNSLPAAGASVNLVSRKTNINKSSTVIDNKGYFEFIFPKDTLDPGIYDVRFYGANLIEDYQPEGSWETIEIRDANQSISVSLHATPGNSIKFENNSYNPSSVTLTVNTYNIFMPQYKWYKDLVLVSGETSDTLVVNPAVDLATSPSASYKCEITGLNIDGEEIAPRYATTNLVKFVDGVSGIDGPGITYRGVYSSSKTYVSTNILKDVVNYNGTYYICNHDGATGAWNAAYWDNFGANFESVATGLLLAEDAVITRSLIMGEASASGPFGLIRSVLALDENTGNGFYLANTHDGTGRFRIGEIVTEQTGSGAIQPIDPTNITNKHFWINPSSISGADWNELTSSSVTKLTSIANTSTLNSLTVWQPSGNTFLSANSIASSKQFISNADTWTLIAVLKNTSGPIISKYLDSGGTSLFMIDTAAGVMRVYLRDVQSRTIILSTQSVSSWTIFSITYNNKVLTVTINGQKYTATNANFTSFTIPLVPGVGSGFFLNGQGTNTYTPSSYGTGTAIAEIITTDDVKSDEDIDGLCSFLAQKYNLTWTNITGGGPPIYTSYLNKGLYWNGTDLIIKASNFQLTDDGKLWANSGGFGGTSILDAKVSINTEGLKTGETYIHGTNAWSAPTTIVLSNSNIGTNWTLTGSGSLVSNLITLNETDYVIFSETLTDSSVNKIYEFKGLFEGTGEPNKKHLFKAEILINDVVIKSTDSYKYNGVTPSPFSISYTNTANTGTLKVKITYTDIIDQNTTLPDITE